MAADKATAGMPNGIIENYNALRAAIAHYQVCIAFCVFFRV